MMRAQRVGLVDSHKDDSSLNCKSKSCSINNQQITSSKDMFVVVDFRSLSIGRDHHRPSHADSFGRFFGLSGGGLCWLARARKASATR